MFGCESTSVIGKSIQSLIPVAAHINGPELQKFLDDINKGQQVKNAREMVAKKQDGGLFPIHISLSEGHISGKSFCAAFIRYYFGCMKKEF